MFLVLALNLCGGAHEIAADDAIQFDRDIAPILAEHCYECHGPDAKKREAGLRLDLQAGATTVLESGNTAIVRGDLTNSELFARITSADVDQRMPPADSNRSLTARQIELVRRWIEQGAAWSKHWSLNRLHVPAIPDVSNIEWPSNAIDRFILARLDRRGIAPAVPADRYTLIRRVYFDLIGLPPTPEQVEGFVDDNSPGAYERLVDQLLASPHYGERWGRHWLDVARYGDSNGGDENHAYPHAYHYRDWVIAALNRDLPYDRFVALQLAGDLLPADPRFGENNLAATGFLAIGMKILAEKDKTKMRADMVDEQLDTFGKAFLGLSIGCARCHDHKFDPIPTKDYYALAGIFHSTNVANRELQPIESDTARKQREQQVAKLQAEITVANTVIEKLAASGAAITREAEKFDRGNVIVDDSNYGKGIGIISDPGAQKNFAEYDLNVARAGQYVVQLRYAAQQSRPGRLIINGKTINDKAIARTTGSWFPDTQSWFIEGACELKPGNNTLRLESDPLMSHIDKIRIISAQASGDLTKRMQQFDQLNAALAKLKNYEQAKKVTVMAVSDGAAGDVRVHRRGNHLDLGDAVQRGFLDSLGATELPAISEKQSGRLQLAAWLTDRSSPPSHLLARVLVNRVWHWHFGQGIVTTPNDFGLRGQRPTHPKLLDYLARRLIDDGWSLKRLHRLIVTSQTYCMSSVAESPKALLVDSANQLLWRQRRRRLEAEVIRDAMLVVTGQLEPQMGGQPVVVKAGDPSPEDLRKNRMAYDSARQRSVYLPIVRTNVYRFFTLFDFPNAATPVGKRSETTIATQALFVMNSPLFARLSDQLADRVLTGGIADDREKIDDLIRSLYGRPATTFELQKFESFLTSYEESVDVKSDAASRRREAWRALCHVLLASNEFMYVN
jgi:hypothetical protein